MLLQDCEGSGRLSTLNSRVDSNECGRNRIPAGDFSVIEVSEWRRTNGWENDTESLELEVLRTNMRK